ncbi:flagellar basal-body rod protein FlgF [Phaeovibrio sulfidiphilus]|uniref:Flagellar basal-body rod protein FlgF n=1 Tax=Phaeovibrio sulfidiphilus TaxID=1220600 RepID=A0A8J6YPY8_9PROT|nr:flagellar basal-body rod protein FlgF [Phaeovibrio sulfidiphilus]MBE1237779.1 flagellar basal-body rod protein FlgF [Phaeovibrio sulfidiphilus]
MENTSYIALTGQMALWRKMDSVSNNLANMDTEGYQSESLVFSDYLVGTRSTGRRLKENLAYTQTLGAYRDLSVGPIKETGNALDLAIEGEGYFELDTDAGPVYTRAGRFTLNPDGMIIALSGHPLMSETGQPIVLAPNEGRVTISGDGSVSTENGVIGRIRLVTFEDQLRMRRVGGGVLDAGGQDPKPVERPAISQGMVEGSNVNPIVEITKMIEVQRAYESTNNLLEQENDRKKKAYQALSGAKGA